MGNLEEEIKLLFRKQSVELESNKLINLIKRKLELEVKRKVV